jgi:cob(I)alamin adenosyltransferase
VRSTTSCCPAGCEEASRLHVARTVIRRAEASLTEMIAEEDEVDPHVLPS